jgi:RimJ/RimL family protein N-acetyltransferase
MTPYQNTNLKSSVGNAWHPLRPLPADATLASTSTGPVLVRRAVPDDAAHLTAMHRHLSPLSRYQRYMAPYVPDQEEMEAIGRLPSGKGEAFVAETVGAAKHMVGLIYYIRSKPPQSDRAEFGITVVDDFQGQGLGRAMLEHMCERAKANGVHWMEANVLPQNKKMLHLLDTCGRPLRKRRSMDYVTAVIDLAEAMDEASLICFLSEAAEAADQATAAALCG